MNSHHTFRRTAIILAGGRGTRMGAGRPKQFLEFGNGCVLDHTTKQFLASQFIAKIITVLHPDWLELWVEHINSLGWQNRVLVVAGGETRTQSVLNGLLTLQNIYAEEVSLVSVNIHDGVRPFPTQKMIADAFEAAEAAGGAVCCVPVKVSLRQKTEAGNQAVERSLFWEVQTPQAFKLNLILDAYQRLSHASFSDDASLFETAGHTIKLVEGSYDNIKITTPEDFDLGKLILSRFSSQSE